MERTQNDSSFEVGLQLQVPGPVRPRTKYKKHRLLTASLTITLPFVPFPGMLLTFELPPRRGRSSEVHLRIRTVEWLVSAARFNCIVDELTCAPEWDETLEVRSSPRIEQHFLEAEKSLRDLGFEVRTDMESASWALYKTASGIDLRDPADKPPPPEFPWKHSGRRWS